MSVPAEADLDPGDQPIRRSVRRLRWFKSSFSKQVEGISAQSGVRYTVDTGKLTATFLEWLREFEAQKPSDPSARRAYVGFAAGLMLQSLVKHRPLKAESVPDGADSSNPAYFWPEGYVYVAYCLNIRSAVLEQDFHEHRDIAPEMDEIRNWWSFKENVSENSSLALAFLDLFSGEHPNWSQPTVFAGGQAQIAAPQFYEARRIDPD